MIVTFASCSTDDDGINFFFEAVPVQSVELPDTFVRGEVYSIKIKYLRPTNCHNFNSFDYTPVNNERTVAIINTVFTDRSCEDIEEPENEVEVALNFLPGNSSSYVFRFWQGRDTDGEHQFLVVEVPVVEFDD